MTFYNRQNLGRFTIETHFSTIATSDATSTSPILMNNTGHTLELKAAYVVSSGAYTGAATNFRSIEITDGTEMASWDGDKGNDLVANTAQALTLNATVASRRVASGVAVTNTVRATFTENGTGLGLTQGILITEWESAG